MFPTVHKKKINPYYRIWKNKLLIINSKKISGAYFLSRVSKFLLPRILLG